MYSIQRAKHMQTLSPTIVTGQLVEEPSNSLRKTIKFLCFVYALNACWMFIVLSSQHATTAQWLHFFISTAIFVFLLPVCGLSASNRPGSGKIALFSGAQGCLGFWNFGNLVSLVSFSIILSMLCQQCQPEFVSNNATCWIGPANTSGIHFRDNMVIEQSTCDSPNPSMATILSGVLLFLMATSSCTVAFKARRTGKTKMVHVVTVEPIPLHRSPMHMTTPQIPEDL